MFAKSLAMRGGRSTPRRDGRREGSHPAESLERTSPGLMLWHLQIDPGPGQIDLTGRRVAADASELGLPGPWTIAAARGFLIEGTIDKLDVARAAETVLVDPAVESFEIRGTSEFATA